ncbi:MAG: hypothetical protein F4X92_10710 [Gammaproteobacteria bacterium]|nr:hypothetical protein [Gammaproteobacteria bacterium]
MKDFIKPFERDLAIRELRALCRGPLLPLDGPMDTASVFSIQANNSTDLLRDGLAYWWSVGLADEGLTQQVLSEATSKISTLNSFCPQFFAKCADLHSNPPRRRCLRYATHGIHEYRGKFFPQLVRALINIASVPSNGIVVDPMCGSGTTLVESRLTGRTTYGLDMNPLSAFVARIKCEALSLPAPSLPKTYAQLQAMLDGPRLNMNHHKTLSLTDQEYLKRWFAKSTLRELDEIHAAIQRLRTASLRNFYTICLSNVLRSVSWQKNDDLRIRKEVVTLEEGEVANRFLIQARRSAATVAAFISECGQLKPGGFEVIEADARESLNVLKPISGKVDAVITSPPYATALPYIDTDRLSLIYLGLLSKTKHASRDRLMIGNREVSNGIREKYWSNYMERRNWLPEETCEVIDRIDYLNNQVPAGFRRKNLAALLSKYFFDMREVLVSIQGLLRPGGDAFLVVGNNRTTAGGELIHIRTSDHLAAIAGRLGFKIVETLSMDMLPSRDIFRKNAVPSEKIIRLQAP